ncbi:unnamed protein product [Nyctereutes procyonoides]|uniref:(raccoon dog) hypothetical protein n=1 Tax=Nyctereutes procyonoides TaxID=34880 RepID=A0A811YEQ1_NYCPR|nr:unnamed protein product [Nyctereutes procyonoides]
MTMASTVVVVGLPSGAHVEPQTKQAFQSLPKSAFNGGYCRGDLEPKMTKREEALTQIAARMNEAEDFLKGETKEMNIW